MAAMKVNDLGKDDLLWQIQYNSDRCTFCGKCVAACPFNAIEATVEKRKKVISEGPTPVPKVNFQTVPIIKQNINIQNYCRGCGICGKVCPNDAIRPVRNYDERFAMKVRAFTGDSYKRGGRNNLNTDERSLDKIYVGRISQMTDPSLDAQRHTFEMLAPFGRVLPPEHLPFKNVNGQLELDKNLPPVRWIYPIIIGDMSIGALSGRNVGSSCYCYSIS